MFNVIEVKKAIVESVANIRSIKSEIAKLKWKPGSEDAVRLIRSEKVDGRRVHGKKALKPFINTETVEKRYSLRCELPRSVYVRALYLILAMIRNKPYYVVESNAKSKAVSWYILQALDKMFAIKQKMSKEEINSLNKKIMEWIEVNGPSPLYVAPVKAAAE